jgi:hypothetical protein
MLLLAVAAAEEHAAPLVMPNWAFALTAFIIFAVLGFVTWSFRDVANRHSDRIHGAGHAGADQHAGH